jgi:hypothetical protein
MIDRMGFSLALQFDIPVQTAAQSENLSQPVSDCGSKKPLVFFDILRRNDDLHEHISCSHYSF